MGAVRRTFAALVLGIVAAGLTASAGVASADPGRATSQSSVAAEARRYAMRAASSVAPGLAEFEGTLIDISSDWGRARACIAAPSVQVLECFSTVEALDARVEALAPQPQYAAAFSCSSPLRLYENTWYGGRQLQFYGRGFWQNLGDYGFNDQLSSYRVGGCTSYLAEHPYGGGSWHPGPTWAYAEVSAMAWGWNDRVSSIYIT